jgi:hypothetical protein
MEVVEIIVFLTATVIIGTVFLFFIRDINYQGIYESLHDMLTGNKEVKFEKVTREDLAPKIYNFWEECGYGEKNKSVSLYVQETGTFGKQELFDSIKKMSLCETLQSASNECGKNEQVVMSTISLPAVINFKCNSGMLYITS